jgi:hypothetical protein
MTMLEAMMANAANTSYNQMFEDELQKSVVMEGMNKNTVKRLKTRRQKLKAFAAARAAPTAPLSMNGLLKGPVPSSLNYEENEPMLPSRSPTPFADVENSIRPPSPIQNMRRRKTRKMNHRQNRYGRR